jgi:hypothetical protein
MNWKKESVDEKQDFPRSADKFLKKRSGKFPGFPWHFSFCTGSTYLRGIAHIRLT